MNTQSSIQTANKYTLIRQRYTIHVLKNEIRKPKPEIRFPLYAPRRRGNVIFRYQFVVLGSATSSIITTTEVRAAFSEPWPGQWLQFTTMSRSFAQVTKNRLDGGLSKDRK